MGERRERDGTEMGERWERDGGEVISAQTLHSLFEQAENGFKYQQNIEGVEGERGRRYRG